MKLSLISCFLLVFLIATTFYTSAIAAEDCIPSRTQCGFYKCVEKKNPCGDRGYAIGYGWKYCNKFDRNNYKTEAAKVWTKDVRQCLQRQLLPFSYGGKHSCTKITDYAFDSHPACYTGAGLCSIVRRCMDVFNWNGYCTDVKTIIATVDMSDLLTRRSAKQMKDTLVECVKRGAGYTHDQFENISSWVNRHFDDDDDAIVADNDEKRPLRSGLKRLADAFGNLETDRSFIVSLDDDEMNSY